MPLSLCIQGLQLYAVQKGEGPIKEGSWVFLVSITDADN